MTNYNKYLERLKSKDNNIENYYYKELKGNVDSTILNHLISISKLFETEKQRNEGLRAKDKDFNLNHSNINQLTEQDIKDFLDSEWWNNLSNGTQKMHTNRIKKYLKYSEKKDLLDLFPNKFNGKTKKLSKIDLITKVDLDQILKYSNLQYRTLFMILYEGALRIDEALNIREKDIKFNSAIITIIKISESKTYGRDVPVIDSTPYIKEYLRTNDFEPEDKLFNFKYNINVNNYLNFIKKKLIKKYPKKWKGRKLYPHLFRHSRLTELAKTIMNEAQIRKFAGWSADSTMAKIYFHLNDEDVINILTNNVVEAPKPEPRKPKICGICKTENKQINLFCWNCGNVFSDKDKKQMGIEAIIQPYEVKELRQENNRLLTQLNTTNDKVAELTDYIKAIGSYVKREYEIVSEELTCDLNEEDSEYFKTKQKNIAYTLKKIEKLGSE